MTAQDVLEKNPMKSCCTTLYCPFVSKNLFSTPTEQSLLDRGLFAKALPEREHARSPDLDPGPDPLGLRHALAMMLAAWIGMAAAAVALVGEMMAASGRLRRILLSRRRGRGGGGGGGRGQGMVVMVGRRF